MKLNNKPLPKSTKRPILAFFEDLDDSLYDDYRQRIIMPDGSMYYGGKSYEGTYWEYNYNFSFGCLSADSYEKARLNIYLDPSYGVDNFKLIHWEYL